MFKLLTRKYSSSKLITVILVLFPIALIFLSEGLSVSYKGISSICKLGAALYMFLYAVLKLKYSERLLLLFVLFIPFFIYGIWHSFNINAALTEGVRYLFPITVLFYSYAIKEHFKLLLMVFIIFVLVNDLAQVVNYINWFRGKTQWFYLYYENGTRHVNMTSGIIRATGIVVFFGLFGFMNLVAYFLTKYFYFGKRKKLLLSIFIVSMFLSLSYKTIGTFALILFLEYRNKLKLLAIVGVLFLAALVSIPETLASMGENVAYRIKEYVIEGDSARGESYKVMFSDFAELNMLGRGVGSFGGPSSVTYNSPVYFDVNFNWYKTTNLATTDTYFPHLFVEMGIIGGLMYLLVIIAPFFLMKWQKQSFKMAIIIYSALFLDSLFSYSLNNLAFCICSLLFVYPLYFYRHETDEERLYNLKENLIK